ncbi:MAG: alpha/beta hydrolase [Treponema sp.]|jgi:fermentation-respiration switch protein FrsA (DUF1100 family)|nr:alpha/beta hydrolase [Treponema sp.]
MVAIGAALCAVLLIALGIFFFAPRYFYHVAVERKAPLPGSVAFLKAEAQRLIKQPRLWVDEQNYERAVIVSHDGLTLEGLFVASPARVQDDGQGTVRGWAGTAGRSLSADTVILAHGYNGDARQLSDFARRFYERFGYNVLLPHARGHGASQGDAIGFGWPDRLDYLRWIDWVIRRTRSQTETPVRIVLFGVSMGAATVLMTGGEEALPPDVKAIIEDCGYTSVEEELRYQLNQQYRLRSKWLFDATSRLTQKRAGYLLEEASALTQVKKIKVPTLFIHGDADTFVPFKMVYALYEACTVEKELFVVHGAGHGMASETAGEEYNERIATFLEKYLP